MHEEKESNKNQRPEKIPRKIINCREAPPFGRGASLCLEKFLD
jgi:hypothetical protein